MNDALTAVSGTIAETAPPGAIVIFIGPRTLSTVALALGYLLRICSADWRNPGKGALATIQFKALKAGTTNLTLDFTPNATTDTNVSSFGSDVLASVTNA